MSHTQSSHECLMIGEGGAIVGAMACSGFETLTGDVEPRNRLGKVRARKKLILEGLLPENQLPASHSLAISNLRLDQLNKGSE